MADVEPSTPTPSPGAPSIDAAASSPAKSAAAVSTPAEPANAHSTDDSIRENSTASTVVDHDDSTRENSTVSANKSSVSSSVSSAPSAPSATATPSTTTIPSSPAPLRRRKKGPAVRPVEGGLAIGFTADELKAQAAKRAAWLQEDVEEHNAIRAKVASNEEKTSSRALSFMLLMWVLVIAAIFFHVYRTMANGLANGNKESNRHLPASTLIFNAFKAQLAGTSNNDDSDDRFM